MRKIVITQSNYIPWKGYFDALATSDCFVIYDDMQYTKRDWRNRNLIKTAEGLKWLTIPVEVKGKYYQKINETRISNKNWNREHLSQLKLYYKNANNYSAVLPWIENLYLNCNFELLTHINEYFLKHISAYLGLSTNILRSENFFLDGDRTERLVGICQQLEATDYYTGPAAKAYMSEEMFEKVNISVHYFDYTGYQPYKQLHNPFEHSVTILDLIFNEGVNAIHYLKTHSQAHV
ncbi:MAG: hypothetical protein RL596_2020 [Bacteroidota bacterium]|jgi:hypothetical protein